MKWIWWNEFDEKNNEFDEMILMKWILWNEIDEKNSEFDEMNLMKRIMNLMKWIWWSEFDEINLIKWIWYRVCDKKYICHSDLQKGAIFKEVSATNKQTVSLFILRINQVPYKKDQ